MLGRESLPLSVPVPRAGRTALTGAASATLHVAALLAVVTVPLLLDSPLPEQSEAARAFFAEPIALAVPPPPPPPAAARDARAQAPSPSLGGFVAPVEVPTEIVPEGLDLGVEGGVSGVEGGVPGGVVGGVIGGLPEAPPPPRAQPLRAGTDIQPPRRIKHVAPAYPELARQAGVEGVVILECLIDERGRVQEAKVVKARPLLDEAALNAVRQWVYLPTLYNGVPTPVLMTLTVTFELKRGL